MIDERTLFSSDPFELATLRNQLQRLTQAAQSREREMLRTALSEPENPLPTDAAALAALEDKLKDALAEVQQRRAQAVEDR
ncbi:hypothetical protein DXT93_32490 [Agrobacterium rhizogenes]|nr:hypothetical protein [Rhizobium rhizogenes]